MNFRNISAWSIRNPIPPIVLFVALTLAGLISFMRMDINAMPDVEFPVVSVAISQPGAAPTELETQVTQRVEAAVRGVNGVDEITSFVGEGYSRTVIQFDIGTPVDRAVNDARNAVSQIRSELPEGILEPQVTRQDVASGGPIAYISAEATDMSLEELSWYVDNTVAKRLLSIPGMANVGRGGGVSREIRVILDPAKMQAQGVTAAQVNAQLRQTNLNAAGGRAEIAGSEQAVRVLGNAADAYALGETQISVGAGRTVKLSDIAVVRDLYAEQRSLAMMDGKQVLSFGVEKAKGSSDVTVYNAVKEELKKLEQESGKVHFTELFTSVKYTNEQYTSAMEAMVEGAVLAVLVVLIFLRDWRATIISALAIPMSAIPAFWFMDMLGFTLNTISLLALSLVAGVLVDDAIVEIENIVRHMRMGKSAYQASIDAADEIGLAVLATTMAIVAVFLPVGLMPGLSGQIFKQFGLTVVIAVLMSLAVARLITPMIAAYFLKSHGQQSHGENWLMDRYMGLLRLSLRHRWKTALCGLLAFVATIFAFGSLPTEFQPTTNSDFSQVRIEMVPGSTVQQTQAVTERVAAMLRRQPEVEKAFSDINPTAGTIYLTLRKEREKSSVEFERSMAPHLNEIADARVTFASQSGGGSGRDLTIALGGDDPAVLTETANKIIAEMSALPEVVAPRVNGDVQRPEITIKPRLDLAADLGVTTSALSQTIRIATLGEIDQNSAKFSLSDRQIPIRVALEEGSRKSLGTIQNLPVPTSRGGTVPLKLVADISFGAGPTELRRYNQVRRTMIGADLAPGLVTSQAMKKIEALPTMSNLPQGVRRLTMGDSKFEQEMITNFMIAVLSGVFMVFAVLVLLYKRILPPFVNMGSLLLAPLGGALALHLSGMAMSMPVYIGLLMLLGIVCKNSILLVDFALEEMDRGVDKWTAIMEAGHKRAQPIVMTTVAMVAGMVPTAVSLNGDAAWRAPMGVTVIGGLILSTILTLVIVPACFSLAVGFEQRLGPKLRRIFTNGGEDGHPVSATQPAE
ncbi:efflux RND transporter permease subunit [Sphingosinicella sp. BN140058]|uniref:efflux RND transporter permease subunit n=1 Tax=Sphingosinicella sp. BN140058 TaxID=1892855 RepID=UPI0010117F12|nr:efflux RND transporter permease subunit [Sphingosinicella sp. BN140058]QAY76163.1 efflux RND transporter permease subunit [Sphingosinicella sp. BN140058]